MLLANADSARGREALQSLEFFAQAELFHTPKAITRCGNGDLFVADTNNHRVRRIAADTGIVTTVLGDGIPASPATIKRRWTLAKAWLLRELEGRQAT